MTYLDAAHTILKTAGQPLHFDEITQRALGLKPHLSARTNPRRDDQTRTAEGRGENHLQPLPKFPNPGLFGFANAEEHATQNSE